ncbi:MAG: adenylosuccinate lyase [Flavobacteriaceae bacterium]|nr:adenylosuccinate lyase [Bacteroidia bacterium]NNK82304.1 adenylosuccinate lyase [Flavobacteriaceae bacterium]
MTTRVQLYKELEFVNHSKANRKKYALLVIQNPELFPIVLDFVFDVNEKNSHRATWLLEFIAREDLDAILPHLDRITSEMHKIHKDSAVRPIAKICEYLIEAYYSKHINKTKRYLKPVHKEKIVELCFDYLITDKPIAPQAYAMNILYLLGKDYDWIHPELVQVLEKNYASGSKGYKARARFIFYRLNK